MRVSPPKAKNIDFDEVHKFDKMAQAWWDPNGPCRALHALNPLRMQFIQSCCRLSSKSVLDLGCGGGILTETLSQFSEQVIGIDVTESLIQIATTHAAALPHPPTYRTVAVEDLAQESDALFDIITCMEMLEHVPAPDQILKACATLLKPGGMLILSTLNRTPRAFFEAIIGAEYVLKLLPKGTHQYERFIRPSELEHWARPFSLYLKKIRGIQYHVLNKSFSLCNKVSVNYLTCFEKAM